MVEGDLLQAEEKNEKKIVDQLHQRMASNRLQWMTEVKVREIENNGERHVNLVSCSMHKKKEEH